MRTSARTSRRQDDGDSQQELWYAGSSLTPRPQPALSLDSTRLHNHRSMLPVRTSITSEVPPSLLHHTFLFLGWRRCEPPPPQPISFIVPEPTEATSTSQSEAEQGGSGLHQPGKTNLASCTYVDP